MKISEMLVELHRILDEQGDVECVTYDSDYGCYHGSTLNFDEVHAYLWDDEKNHVVRKNVKAVVIEA